MTNKKRSKIAPRVLNKGETARYLGRSATWLLEHRNDLEKTGFPRPLPLVGGYDKAKVDAWLESIGVGDTDQGRIKLNGWDTVLHEEN